MVTDFLPQEPPFVMIDNLLSANEQEIVSEFTVRAGHLFVANNLFTEPGLIENMAQTAAAGTGYAARQKNENPPVGFIGAIKDWKLYRLPRVGETITSTMTMMHNIMNVQVVKGEIKCGDEAIASAEFKIFLQE